MRLSKIIGMWVVYTGLLFWNGVLGIAVFRPLLGWEAAEMMTLFIALSLMFGAARVFLQGEHPQPRSQIIRASVVLMTLTLLFEVAFGRATQLLVPRAAPVYGMWDGSFWPLIVLAAGAAPAAWLRRADLPPMSVTK
jgi:hypothetical protein